MRITLNFIEKHQSIAFVTQRLGVIIAKPHIEINGRVNISKHTFALFIFLQIYLNKMLEKRFAYITNYI